MDKTTNLFLTEVNDRTLKHSILQVLRSEGEMHLHALRSFIMEQLREHMAFLDMGWLCKLCAELENEGKIERLAPLSDTLLHETLAALTERSGLPKSFILAGTFRLKKD